MSRFYSSSLVPRHWHDADLVELMQQPLSEEMITFVAAKTMECIKCRPPPQAPPSPPTTPGAQPKSAYSTEFLPPLDHFIHSILVKSRCHVPTLLCTLVYLERLKKRLPTHARGCHTTRHRVFLAVLIVAAKYLNDSSPQNKHWQRYAAFFQLNEITLMERQLLTILNFDLNFTETELIASLGTLLRPDAVEAVAADEPMQATPAATPPSLENEALAAQINASAIDTNLIERGTAAKRKRLVPRSSMTPPMDPPEGDFARPTRRMSTRPAPEVSAMDVERRASLKGDEIAKPPRAAGASPGVPSPAPAQESSSAPAPDMPSAPAPAFRRPPLRSFLLRASITEPPRPSRVQSWASEDSYEASSYRSSYMSCSSTSTISTTSSGPHTPPTPLEEHPAYPSSRGSFAKGSSQAMAGGAPEALVVDEHEVVSGSVAPTPSLIQALALQPDLWPLMLSSASSTKDARALSSTAQKQRARLIETGDGRRRGSSLISV